MINAAHLGRHFFFKLSGNISVYLNMTSMRIDILNPKAEKLIKYLADLKLIAIKEPFESFSEKPQTIAQYNDDLEKGDMEIENGEFTTAADLKKEADKW
jgi:hypothetical protein